ncbi:MAG: nucleoside deaminase [Alphaproteobacteria bacterium]|nr:nucleoside deaminase [Alphaproteobacteria bacterium]
MIRFYRKHFRHQYPLGLMGLVVLGVWLRFAGIVSRHAVRVAWQFPARNRIIAARDPSAHAEMLAIRAAAQALGSERLIGCDLYVTLEPCAMCAGAISLARLRRVYYAAPDMKGGAIDHGARIFSHPTCHHVPEVYGGIRESQSADLLRDFFKARRS